MDAAELQDDDLHDKRMARRKRERAEKESMKAEIVRLRAALEEARALASRRGPTDAIGALNRIEAIAVAALRHQQGPQEPK